MLESNLDDALKSYNMEILDYNKMKSITQKTPLAIVYQSNGEIYVSDLIRQWKEIYCIACRYLYHDYKNVLRSYMGRSFINSATIDIAEKESQVKSMIEPKMIADDVYIETHLTTDRCLLRIYTLLNLCKIDRHSLLIVLVDNKMNKIDAIKAYYKLKEIVLTKSFRNVYGVTQKVMITELKHDLEQKIKEYEQKKDVVSQKAEIRKQKASDTVIINDLLIHEIKAMNIPYVDNRHKAGCLWLFGDQSLIVKIALLENKLNVKFHYSEHGGKSTRGKSAWLTREIVQTTKGNSKLYDYKRFLQQSNLKGNTNKKVYKDFLIYEIEKLKLPYIDKRHEHGCLWVLGGSELQTNMGILEEEYNIKFYYSEKGGHATKGKSAWWTTAVVLHPEN